MGNPGDDLHADGDLVTGHTEVHAGAHTSLVTAHLNREPKSLTHDTAVTRAAVGSCHLVIENAEGQLALTAFSTLGRPVAEQADRTGPRRTQPSAPDGTALSSEVAQKLKNYQETVGTRTSPDPAARCRTARLWRAACHTWANPTTSDVAVLSHPLRLFKNALCHVNPADLW